LSKGQAHDRFVVVSDPSFNFLKRWIHLTNNVPSLFSTKSFGIDVHSLLSLSSPSVHHSPTKQPSLLTLVYNGNTVLGRYDLSDLPFSAHIFPEENSQEVYVRRCEYLDRFSEMGERIEVKYLTRDQCGEIGDLIKGIPKEITTSFYRYPMFIPNSPSTQEESCFSVQSDLLDDLGTGIQRVRTKLQRIENLLEEAEIFDTYWANY